MNYDEMTVIDLKTLCRQRGLRVSGNKNEVIIRLMENDEQTGTSQPQRQAQVGYHAQHGTNAIPTQYIPVKSENEMAKTIASFVVLYAFFRLFWALIFSVGFGSDESWLLAPIAFIIGIGFLIGGAIMYQGYRNGAYITLGVLSFSAILSVWFHGSEPNPVSIAWGDEMVMTSLMCSAMCIVIVCLPLFLTQLKAGWPEQIEQLLARRANTDVGKVNVQCANCRESLKVPKTYSGMIQCPSCKSEMRV